MNAEPEECFNIVITEEDISEGNPDDYVCCYLKQLEVMRGECFRLNKNKQQFQLIKMNLIEEEFLLILLLVLKKKCLKKKLLKDVQSLMQAK